LIAVNQVDPALAILNRALPTLQDLLITQHPQLYYVLAEMSLDTTDSELGRLRAQIKQFAAGVSQNLLGVQHPITQLLRLNLSHQQTVRLRELIQRKIHELHEHFFSVDSNQTTGQHYFLARILSQLGQTDEAARILSSVIAAWEASYGTNSMMSVTGLLELSKVRLAQGKPDAQAERLLNDGLRRTLTLETDGQMRPLWAEILHCRIGCLRTLGRLYIMRDNYDGALQCYTHAVTVGIDQLGPASPAVQLVLADLDAASKMAVEANANLSVGKEIGQLLSK